MAGPIARRALRPDPSQVAGLALPGYESEIDHAGMIADLGPANLERGEIIYNRVCINCHGTKDRPGSLPTSLRFAAGGFKNGSDPYSLYQTLTHGFGQMPPQTWMVPAQKYDVIQYIREAYLKEDNPTQYVRVDRAYLDSSRRGRPAAPRRRTSGPGRDGLRPEPDGDLEIGDDGTNFAYKGIAVRLDPGPGASSRGRQWTVYDHDTLRARRVVDRRRVHRLERDQLQRQA